MKLTNRLSHSTSPYLQQHANNPVAWQPWDDESLNAARELDKPILVSIGYSACHWCHVMEHESFEDQAVADLMNRNFVCIKVDREERPDVDQVYMDAIQALGISGGWPLNVFLTPEQKPFYGGTYFPKETWKRILSGIDNAFKTQRTDIEADASRVAEAISDRELTGTGTSVNADTLENVIKLISEKFDHDWGGIEKAPKFPMPSIWQFLIKYHKFSGDQKTLSFLHFTFQKITNGGIFDLVRGGFARYSVDRFWKVPHFEKMLYDNGQLLSVLAELSALTDDPGINYALLSTCEWIRDEMTDTDGGFYSALDADSEGVEGKYYTWTIDDIDLALGDNAEAFKKYFDISFEGNWEGGQNILFSTYTIEEYAQANGLSSDQFRDYLKSCYNKLKEAQARRVKPGLDHKKIAAWNALCLDGLLMAYRATGHNWIRELAIANAKYLRSCHIRDGKLARIVDDRQQISAFLDDYAAVISAFASTYETTFDEAWLTEADALATYCLRNFSDESQLYFYYTDKNDTGLIARKKEVLDNVIPSSNSMMAHALHRLGSLLSKSEYLERARKMTNGVSDLITRHPEYLTNWASMGLNLIRPTVELAVTGNESVNKAQEISRMFIPNLVLAAAEDSSNLPILKDRMDGKLRYYVCQSGVCHLPVDTSAEAISRIAELRDH